MKHSISHDLDLPTAKLATEKAIESYTEKLAKYDPQAEWVSDHKATISFKAKGVKIDGALELREGAIDVDLNVPFLLRPFKGKAIEVVDREVNEWVNKAKAGEI